MFCTMELLEAPRNAFFSANSLLCQVDEEKTCLIKLAPARLLRRSRHLDLHRLHDRPPFCTLHLLHCPVTFKCLKDSLAKIPC
jgi:hypothetical protein